MTPSRPKPKPAIRLSKETLKALRVSTGVKAGLTSVVVSQCSTGCLA